MGQNAFAKISTKLNLHRPLIWQNVDSSKLKQFAQDSFDENGKKCSPKG